jgi:hypothetical protein
MMDRVFTELAGSLLTAFPVLVRRNKLLHLPVQEGLLRGIFFDSSAFSKSTFYVHVFVMPLYVPSEHLNLSFGSRLAGNWDIDATDTLATLKHGVENEAMPFLLSCSSIQGFVAYLQNSLPKTPRILEALGYSIAKLGLILEAASVFSRIPDDLDTTISWQKELHDRAIEYRATLISNPNSAIEELTLIETKTRTHLGLLN